jgi:hypothetical protein
VRRRSFWYYAWNYVIGPIVLMGLVFTLLMVLAYWLFTREVR